MSKNIPAIVLCISMSLVFAGTSFAKDKPEHTPAVIMQADEGPGHFLPFLKWLELCRTNLWRSGVTPEDNGNQGGCKPPVAEPEAAGSALFMIGAVILGVIKHRRDKKRT